MSKVDKRAQAALAAITKASGVSEPAVLKVIKAMKEVDSIGVTLLLGVSKEFAVPFGTKLPDESIMDEKTAKKMREYYQKQIDNLTFVYGTGVRPGWVSAEIAMAEVNKAAFDDIKHPLN